MPKLEQILKKINALIYEPNFTNPANFYLANIYRENEAEYWRLLSENVNYLDSC